MPVGYLGNSMSSVYQCEKGEEMIRRQSAPEPFVFWLIREFLATKEDASEDLQPISSKEFYSVLGMLFAGILLLAVTIGPFKIL
jgi:hypothetical protein